MSRKLLDAPLPTLSHAVKKGSVSLTYKPSTTHIQISEQNRVLAETTTYCDERCDGFEFGGVTYLPKEGDVIVTVNGTDYDVGDYQICMECMEYYYGFNHIRNWTVFNYDLDKNSVIEPEFKLVIPKVEGTSGGGTTTLALNGEAIHICNSPQSCQP